MNNTYIRDNSLLYVIILAACFSCVNRNKENIDLSSQYELQEAIIKERFYSNEYFDTSKNIILIVDSVKYCQYLPNGFKEFIDDTNEINSLKENENKHDLCQFIIDQYKELHKYIIIPADTITNIFDRYKTRDAYDYLRKEYPNSVGFIQFWFFNISSSGKYAIGTLDYYCGGLCGDGIIYLLEKRNGKWIVIHERTIWVS